MARIIFDTDILIDYLLGIKESADFLFSFPKEDRFVTSISVMEIFRGARDKRELEVFKRFIRENFYQILHLNEQASKLSLNLVETYILSHGLTIPDALIAGIALANDAELLTGNLRHFEFIQELKVSLPAYRG